MRAATVAMLSFGVFSAPAVAQRTRSPTIVPAPAFTADQLVAAPTENWITNGGSVFNQRYSPLDQINRGNVAQLRALWRTSMGSAADRR